MLRTCLKKVPSLLSSAVISHVFKRSKVDLAGKSVVITGGITGIGLETVKVLLTRNVCNLAILDINEDIECLKKLAEACPGANLVFCKTDVCNKDEFMGNLKNVVEKKFGGCLNLMINNAGVINESNPSCTVKVNLLGVIYGTLGALCYMDKSRGFHGGQIANVASVLGLEPCAPLAAYTATKHGVIGWTRSLAEPICYENTCVSHMALCPGVTESPMIKDVEDRVLFPYTLEQAKKFFSKRQSAEDCACCMVKAIEENINGSIWIIDNGKLQRVTPTKYWTQK